MITLNNITNKNVNVNGFSRLWGMPKGHLAMFTMAFFCDHFSVNYVNVSRNFGLGTRLVLYTIDNVE